MIDLRDPKGILTLQSELSKREMPFLIEHANRDAPELLRLLLADIVRAIRTKRIEDTKEIWPYAHKVAQELVEEVNRPATPKRKLPIAA